MASIVAEEIWCIQLYSGIISVNFRKGIIGHENKRIIGRFKSILHVCLVALLRMFKSIRIAAHVMDIMSHLLIL